MTLKKDKDGNVAPIATIKTDNFHYDLFDGGYINPEDQLDEESAARVRLAVDVIRQYENFLELNDIIECF